MTFPVEVTAGGLCAAGLVPRWVCNVGEVGDLRPAVVRFPFNDVGTEEHLQVVGIVDLPVVVGGDVPSLTLGVGHFATNMVGVTTIRGVLEILQFVGRNCVSVACRNHCAGVLVNIHLRAVGIGAKQWRAPSVCHGELRTNLVPNLVFLSVGVIYVHVPILGEIDGKTSVERQIGVLLVGSVGVLHFVVRRTQVVTLVV